METATAIQNGQTDTPALDSGPDVRRVLLHAAWLSIVLGLIMHGLTLAAAVLAGGKLQSVAEFLRDITQKVSWSSLVCAGLALGNAVTKTRPVWTGAIGLLAAPLAFIIARVLHKSAAAALNVASPDSMSTGVFVIVLLIRAAEYAALGYAAAWLGERAWAKLRHFALAGLATGVLFGFSLVGVLYANANPEMPRPKVAAQSVNELFFPIGCALVLYATNSLGRSMRQR